MQVIAGKCYRFPLTPFHICCITLGAVVSSFLSPLPRPAAPPTIPQARHCSWLLLYQRRSNSYSSLTSTSATTTANVFLWTSSAASNHRSRRMRDHPPFIRSITHAPDQTELHRLGFSAVESISSLPSHRGLCPRSDPFPYGFAGQRPQPTVTEVDLRRFRAKGETVPAGTRE